ncbi:MAG: NADH-quinone oxidoreductase subunit D, partial [Microthrixaceae bacterium]|nr:NADH-quinone oxidoreductase subunit D [Microthrixaceae bacterium]
VTVTDRMNYLSPLNNNIGYVQCIEEMMGLELPERGRTIRILMAELSRIADHILSCGLMAMDVGAFSVMLWCFRERERLYDIFEVVTGGRLTTSYTRVGGLSRDLPDNAVPMIRDALAPILETCDEVEKMLYHNRIFLDRSQGVGALTREEAIAYSWTGPLLRATGEAFDVRRARPYLGYDSYDFDVITRTDGDSLARFQVRMDEIRQSVRIVRQALERLKPGPFCADNMKVALPAKDIVYSKMESLIHHFKIIMLNHGFAPPAGEYYSCTESPNGELGFYVVSTGDQQPWRLRVRGPSFLNYSAINRLAQGRMISDVVAILGSLNVIAGELDR